MESVLDIRKGHGKVSQGDAPHQGGAPDAHGLPKETEVTHAPDWLGDPDAMAKESDILAWSPDLLDALLMDRSTGERILWATDSHKDRGDGYGPGDQILPSLVTGDNTGVVRPRVSKARDEQAKRTKGKAEVFTPSWVCNIQNNIVDRAWFGDGWEKEASGSPFNEESDDRRDWTSTPGDVVFADEPMDDPNARSWQAYVRSNRMEIACGEAPYLVSRYDTTTGKPIPVPERIGMLDRKLRVVTENTMFDDEGWRQWALEALRSCYGFEYQGDNLLIARENMLLGWADAYCARLGHAPSLEECLEVAEIVSWNIFQMDGLTYLVPETDTKALVMNWDTGESYPFELQLGRG